MAAILQATPAVLSWLDRMAAYGHGQMSPMSATESIATCAQSTCATDLNDAYFQNDHGIALGSKVSVRAESFGAEVTVGTLVAATRTRTTLRREDARAGWVQVHFPRVGYVLKQEVSA
jgi:hypothetical protein